MQCQCYSPISILEEKVIKIRVYLPLGAESGENPLRMKSVKQRIKRFVHVKSNCFSCEGYKKRVLEEIYFFFFLEEKS